MRSQPEYEARVRFYEELNDFLPPDKKKTPFPYHFNGKPSVKDAIEANGVPHTEVDLIVVNGDSVGFDYHVRHGDYISVYPVFEGLDISPIVKLRDAPLRKNAFVCDVHLGKCARILRLLGFDTLYRNDYDDPKIISIAVTRRRIILTRDRKLLHAKVVTHGCLVRSQKPEEQVREVLERFDLYNLITPFRRCTVCNGLINDVAKQDVLDQLEPKTKKYYFDFYQCDTCGKIYWEGSHFERMHALIKRFMP